MSVKIYFYYKMTEEEENIFGQESLHTLFDISSYAITPNRLNWKITIGDKYGYHKLKKEAQKGYKLITKISSKQDKIIAKMTATEHIMRGFAELYVNIDEALKNFLSDWSVQDLEQNRPEMYKTLYRNIHEEVARYKKKIDYIHNSWYNDWENYGLIEEYEPKMKNYSDMPPEKAVELKNNLMAIFNSIYQKSSGKYETNPLKRWIYAYVKPKLDKFKSIKTEVSEAAFNAATFSPDNVQGKLNMYLLDIPKLADNSISAALYKIDEIMGYIENFTKMEHSTNVLHKPHFKTRIEKIQIKEGYSITAAFVKDFLYKMYSALASKVNTTANEKFVAFLKELNGPYFSSIKDPVDALLEIYNVKNSSTKNSENWDTSIIISLYDEYLRTGKVNTKLSIEKAAAIGNIFKAMGEGLVSFGKWLAPEWAKYYWSNR